MSNFAWCIIGMIVAVWVGIWRARIFDGALKVFFIVGAIATFIFFLLGAIVLYN